MSTHSILGDTDVIDENALPDGGAGGNQTQVPIDSKLRFEDAATGSALLHVAVTGSTPPAGYKSYTEYWSRLGVLKASAITMLSFEFSARQGTPEHAAVLDEWLGNGSVLATDQQAKTGDWIEGVYKPTSPKSALYWALDPDSAGDRRIGLLVELGNADELLNVIWYKTKQPENGLIFQETPIKLAFAKVLDSTDPHKIDNGPWFFYRGVMRPM
ncbi:hypothetical protein SOCE26_009860 [Sorangium cellulosum]|uniref:Uncharacterized protein n=1 Tax=Sorangium cellulosum TaxID=56 RepID=A0A2L0EJV4_SORCE|nr:hypothetical protein [Sorangium cellulosum]AUX39592.1 hypothetical protein SOCE26_009860 [Sorangium cellulosum]